MPDSPPQEEPEAPTSDAQTVEEPSELAELQAWEHGPRMKVAGKSAADVERRAGKLWTMGLIGFGPAGLLALSIAGLWVVGLGFVALAWIGAYICHRHLK